MNGVQLIGFEHSVYTRAVRIALHEKGLGFEYQEVNPFTDAGQTALGDLHPFGRVPVLRHYAYVLYETTAILAYLDDGFDVPRLWPKGAKARGRVTQVQGIADSYLYVPLVRQAFSHAVYQPLFGGGGDPEIAAEGLDAAGPILDALEEIAAAGLVLNGRDMTRADCHLTPMIDYFASVEAGRGMLTARPALNDWFGAMQQRASFIETRPTFLSELGETT